MTNLPTDLLRTFITVVDSGGFTRAGDLLGRSQPAISLQIKRLEELACGTLLKRNGRSLVTTDLGNMLLGYARQMLALNDEVVARLDQPKVAGGIRLGIPNEFAGSFLPDILGKFAQAHPEVTLEVGCDLSTNLLSRLDDGEFDLVFALHEDPTDVPHGKQWPEQLVWVGNPNHAVHLKSPLPLIVAPHGCIYRKRIIETLDRIGKPWRIAYSSPSFGGINAGVQAGLGVTVLAQSTVPDALRVLPERVKLPTLKPIQMSLHHPDREVPPALERLIEFISARLDSANRSGQHDRATRLSRGNNSA